MKIISCLINKGGTGKSSLSHELAYLFGAIGKTLLIDMDPQCSLSIYCGANLKQPNLYNLLNAEATPEQVIQKLEHFDMIASDIRLADSSKEFGDPDDIYLLQDILEYFDYDYVILDQAPARSPLMYMCYLASTDFILVAECDKGSVSGIEEIHRDISRFIKRGTCKGQFNGIVLNRYEKTSMHDAAYDRLEELSKELNIPLFKTKIRKSIRMSECKEAGICLQEYEKYNNAAVDIRSLFKEIQSRW